MAALADDLEFIPLYADESEETILARLVDWANEGLDPDENPDLWVDTREGGHWRTAIMPCVREFARLYDLAGSEVVASAIPLWTWGSYLEAFADVYDVHRLAATYSEGEVTFSGADGTLIAAGTVVGTEPATPDAETFEFETTEDGTIASGTVTVPVRAVESGSAWNVGVNAIVAPSSSLPGITFTNAAATAGGTDIESDEALRDRLLDAFLGQGGGNVRDYRKWARDWPGVGRVTVVPVWDGPNTVLVIVTAPDGGPVSSGVVDGLQADLDPTAGRGDGTAPVGATVTVETAAALNITVAADIEFEPGYSLDGFGGSIAMRAPLTAAVRSYLEAVSSGDEVVVAQVEGRMVTLTGVHDVPSITLNGGAVNIAVPASPPKVPMLVEPMSLTEV